MSLLATTRRAVFRAPRLSRTAVVNAPAHEYVAKREAIVHHAAGDLNRFLLSPISLNSSCVGTTDLWRKIRYVAVFYLPKACY
jgi:hypothetical protein